MKLGLVDYVRDLTSHDNFGEGTLRGWSGHIRDFSHLWVSFLPFFFCFLRHAPRLHFLTDLDDLYVKTRVSGRGCAFWGSQQYLTTFRGQPPKNLPKMGRNRHLSSISDRSEKSTYLENWSTDWHKIYSAYSDRQRGFVGGLATLYYKFKMAADAILDFR